MKPQQSRVGSEPILAEVGPFLREHGLDDSVRLVPLAGGANNRVYRLAQPGRECVLKCYFQNAGDRRDRFGAERAFYTWAWSQGVRRVPEPLGWSQEKGLGLFAFVPGRKLQPQEVERKRVGEAQEFLEQLNRQRACPAARALPVASEACFSVSEHLECVERRVLRLDEVRDREPIDLEALTFGQEQVRPAWSRMRARISREAAGTKMELAQRLSPEQRWLSPSDFGFHNAILHKDGALRFFDFEYAGWDDPAKLICDFFCQPELPVERRFWDGFLDWMARFGHGDGSLAPRARLLLPAYQIKWCCIMMNDFVRTEDARREFAMGAGPAAERKRAQLAKARRALAQVE